MRLRSSENSTPVTWSFAHSTDAARNLCEKCTAKDGNLCPRHNLTRAQREKLVATRCIFINVQPV